MPDKTETCNFCGKGKPTRFLVGAPGVRICNECASKSADGNSHLEIRGQKNAKLTCSFCLREQEVVKLIQGRHACICAECAKLFKEAKSDETARKSASNSKPVGDLIANLMNAKVASELAEEKFNEGKFEEAILQFIQRLILLERVYPEDHPEVLLCMEKLGDSFYACESWSDTLPVYRRLVNIRERQKDYDESILIVLRKMANCSEKLIEFVPAKWSYMRSIEIAEQIKSDSLPDILESCVAMLRRFGRDLDEANQLEARAKKLRGEKS